ncbi:MAG: SDR family NAD(P)-dependent oxidoreductase [Thermoplasmatota archaeon]
MLFSGEEKFGKIINIFSIAGLVGYAGSLVYCASKVAVTNLIRELALDYPPYMINVNAICPGVIKTSITEEFREDSEMRSFLEENTPYLRIGTPEDIAKAAVFLASSESDFLNGENLVVNG